MSLTLKHLKKYDEIYITINVNSKKFSETFGVKIDDTEKDISIIILHEAMDIIQSDTIRVEHYYKVFMTDKEDDEIIFLETDNDEKILEYLSKLNTIDYIIEEEDY